VVIEAGAVVVGPAVLDSGCRVQRDAVIARSVLWNNCNVEGGCWIDVCVLTDNAQVKGGQVVRSRVVFSSTDPAHSPRLRPSAQCDEGLAVFARPRGPAEDAATSTLPERNLSLGPADRGHAPARRRAIPR
jgi:hypothetical protein